MNIIKQLEGKGYTVTEIIEAYLVERGEAVVTLDIKHSLIESVDRNGIFSSIDFENEEDIVPSVDLMLNRF